MTANIRPACLRAHKNLERAVDSRLQFVDEKGDAFA